MVGSNLLRHSGMQAYDVMAPTHLELDLADRNAVGSWLSRHKPDVVVHCAGVVGGIGANLANPVRFLTDNMYMGFNLVAEARSAGIRRMLNLASSCMYPRNAPNPLKEEMILQGELEPTNEGYALAKIAVTRLCEYVCRETPEFQYKTLVPCNLYGRGDSFHPENSHLIPAVIRKLHEATARRDRDVSIWGDGTARREFMYCGDLAGLLVEALDRFDALPPLMNVGLGYDYTIDEYYEAVASVVGYTGAFHHDLTKPAGMRQKLVDCSLAREFGWEPKTSLHDGIEHTYQDFLRSNRGRV